MKKGRSMRCIFTALVLLCASSLGSGNEDKGRDISNIQVSASFKEVVLFDILQFLAKEYKIHIGYETLLSFSSPEKVIDFSCRSCKLEVFLDQVFDNYQDYQWEIKGDFVNVFPKKMFDSLLGIQVDSFEAKDSSLSSIKKMIIEIPEWQAALHKRGLTPQYTSLRLELLNKEPKYTIKLHKTTIREIFNSLSLLSSTSIWIVSKAGDKILLINI